MLRRTLNFSLPAVALAILQGEVFAQSSSTVPSLDNRTSLPSYPAFETISKKIETDYADIESVVVVRKGRLLFEHYKSNSGSETLRDIQSVTKSVLSLAVGVALGQGTIKSIDQPIYEIVSDIRKLQIAPETNLVTVRHLLTMTSGFVPQERYDRKTADDLNYLFLRERAASVGSKFAYDNLSANLLSVVLEAAAGQPLSQFVEANIFRQLGITAFQWSKGPNGHTSGADGLKLQTRDMAKLGQLVLNSGKWQGAQIVPEAYSRTTVTAQNSGGGPVGLSYGYMWWVVPTAAESQTYLASGWGGQLIWVHPPLDLVIAITSAVSLDSQKRGQAQVLLRSSLVRAAAATNPP
jgi:CubicO group peptidase (beta-lactamase class C family)